MVLHKAESVNKIDKITRDVSILLVEREDKWTNAQKELQKDKTRKIMSTNFYNSVNHGVGHVLLSKNLMLY